MAEGKVNRNNHPILVKARHDSYWAGRKEGFNDGFQKGYEKKCEEIHRYYRIILHALETKLDVLNKTLREENLAYSQGYREGYKAAKEDIRYTVEEMQRLMNGILGEVDD